MWVAGALFIIGSFGIWIAYAYRTHRKEQLADSLLVTQRDSTRILSSDLICRVCTKIYRYAALEGYSVCTDCPDDNFICRTCRVYHPHCMIDAKHAMAVVSPIPKPILASAASKTQ